MEKKNVKKVNLELEILELESKLAPSYGSDGGDQAKVHITEGAEC